MPCTSSVANCKAPLAQSGKLFEAEDFGKDFRQDKGDNGQRGPWPRACSPACFARQRVSDESLHGHLAWQDLCKLFGNPFGADGMGPTNRHHNAVVSQIKASRLLEALWISCSELEA